MPRSPTAAAIRPRVRTGVGHMAANERIFVGLGANLGAAAQAVLQAAAQLGELPGTRRVALSSLYCSAPVDAGGPDYVNAVAELRSELEPLEMLAALQSLEQSHGRTRPFPNAPRTLDLDLLLYGAREHHDERLVLPHPRLTQRAFVLVPLLELAPDGRCADGRSYAEALAGLQGQRLERWTAPPFAADTLGP